MFCHSCGTQVANGGQFCPACGQSLASSPGARAVGFVAPANVHVQSGRWIAEGWRVVSADMGMFALLTLVLVALTSVLPVVLQGPLVIGMHIYCMKRMMGRRTEFADLFRGFDFFLPGLVASLIIWLFSSAAALLCLIPGLVVAAMYKFTYLFIFDKRMDFWPALQASHAVVKNDYFGFTLFLLLMILVNVLGALCLVVGLLVSIPVTVAAVTAAYRDLVGFEPDTVNRF